jgi:hypothetical protein
MPAKAVFRAVQSRGAVLARWVAGGTEMRFLSHGASLARRQSDSRRAEGAPERRIVAAIEELGWGRRKGETVN